MGPRATGWEKGCGDGKDSYWDYWFRMASGGDGDGDDGEVKISSQIPESYLSSLLRFFQNVGTTSDISDVQGKDFYSRFIRGLIQLQRLERGRLTCLFSVSPPVTVTWPILTFSSFSVCNASNPPVWLLRKYGVRKWIGDQWCDLSLIELGKREMGLGIGTWLEKPPFPVLLRCLREVYLCDLASRLIVSPWKPIWLVRNCRVKKRYTFWGK